ncbi:aconitate hydratase AcnA [Bacillus sonorensis]|uniref:aconitate hydratase AcnA n=1 Tax=Bacillus sonorensis TaxID=119858 RepID=UPI0018CCC4ED|nr:aconitate hydratase AcnA [Bacillus sonorensis]MBG9914996.1 aconitate hydratase [Bacillus sonorensis]MCF7618375.1 aconitate hydratase AcnA [Bacillus sonorensis]MCY7859352.1 aconitate hydratase AcnA [Bacillus sonorensis]MCY8026981.1 aconitate hydratase AcnA [Bacillus sonorensis]MCY8088587.1 aconitate hydratase AcnA [Bacillus sonorensis]
MSMKTIFDARSSFLLNGKKYYYYRLQALEDACIANVSKLPFSIKILLESLLRQYDGKVIRKEHIENLAKWGTDEMKQNVDIPFKPARIVLQDFTGVPVVVDLASLRTAMAEMGGDPEQINPDIPVDLVIDHAEQVDQFGTPDAFKHNVERGFELNYERYAFFKWATQSFDKFRAVPPSTAIIHQANLEYLAKVVCKSRGDNGEYTAYPDTCLGTDSHTPMINGIGVVGWGTGGIEAEAAMLGQPSYFSAPEVIGIKLKGKLPSGATGTDLALYVTSLLRKKKVVGKFVEFFGDGVSALSAADRATVSNMSPENGATMTIFPIDEETLNYLRLSGRSEEQVMLVETYCKANGLFFSCDTEEPAYTEVIELDLSVIETSVAGPKRPQDIMPLSEVKDTFRRSLTKQVEHHGYGLTQKEIEKTADVYHKNCRNSKLKTGSIVLAAITSCTNTSNPNVMIGAGLLAKKAVEKGLTVPPHVKTSLAPGSKVVTDYLKKANLLPFLEKLGFYLVGYGCTTCVGNSGPLSQEVAKTIIDNDMIVSGVLSGNRNFEGRIHPLIKANFLASPPLVIAYAIAGTIDINLRDEPLGKDLNGHDVYLKDLWPQDSDIRNAIFETITPDLYKYRNEKIFTGNKDWNQLDTDKGLLYEWDPDSTYLQNPPFFREMSSEPDEIGPLQELRVLAKLGDSITTDHISPAGGTIPENSKAGRYLLEKGVKPGDLSSFGSRRGNHHVMIRGGFSNIRLRNQTAPGTEGGVTTYFPTGEIISIYDAAMKYQKDGTGLLVIAGKDYGMGSSRDWAAKATKLLGVKAVLAQSFERIHRSNLALMGVVPLQFKEGENAETLGLTGREHFEFHIDEHITPCKMIKAIALKPNGTKKEFEVTVRFDSEAEIEYYRHGGVLQMVLRNKLKKKNEKTPNR